MKKLQLYEAADYSTFPEFIDGIRMAFGPKPAVSFFDRKGKKTSYTYNDLTSAVNSLAGELMRCGLGGKHISIISENSYEWIVAYLAIVSSGAIAVCIDAEQSDDTIRQMLTLSDADAVFTTDTYIPICQSIIPQEHTFLLSGNTSGTGFKSLAEMCSSGHEYSKAGSALPVLSSDHPAAIVFTSGTSVMSKPVMLSHRGILLNASESMRHVMVYDTVFTHLPFYHTYGMTCSVLNTFIHGSHLIINGNLKTVMRDIQLAQADTIMTVPLLLETMINQMWLNAEKSGKSDSLKALFNIASALRKIGITPKFRALEDIREKLLGSIRIVISGGAALGEDIEKQLSLLGLTVLQGYGITECSPLVAVNSNQCRRFGSVGHVLSSFTCKIVDGEIWLKGPSLMLGYYKSPELNAEVMEEGWFKTGDIGFIDNDGFLFITGRKKNLIVFKNGKKVAPEKMEALVSQLPLVKEVIVYGAASGASADDIKLAASIYPDPERSEGMSSYDILSQLHAGIDEINSHLPFYQHIQMINIRTQPFVKTGTQKIKRYLV